MIVSLAPEGARARPSTSLLFVYMLFLAFPLLWMLSMSFKGAARARRAAPVA